MIEHHHHDLAEPTVSRVTPRYGIAQAIALATGIFFVVIGAVGIARAGTATWTGHAAFLGPFRCTTLLALINLGIGLIFLLEAPSWFGARATCMSMAPLLIVFGLIALLQPVRVFGWNHADAIMYIVAGGVSLIVGILTPSGVVA